jgi:outer membrane protein assembly factor BamB
MGVSSDGILIIIDPNTGQGQQVADLNLTGFDVETIILLPSGQLAVMHREKLYHVDLTTHQKQFISNINSNARRIEAFAFDTNDTLFCSAAVGFDDAKGETFVSLDADTAAVTIINLFNNTDDVEAMAFADDGTLFGYDLTSRDFFTIDKATGDLTAITTLSDNLLSFEFSNSGVLYSTSIPDLEADSDADLVTVNITTGAVTTIGPIGFKAVSLAFVPNGVLGICQFKLAGDCNGDCVVNLVDFALMASSWLVDCNVDPGNILCELI